MVPPKKYIKYILAVVFMCWLLFVAWSLYLIFQFKKTLSLPGANAFYWTPHYQLKSLVKVFFSYYLYFVSLPTNLI